MKNLKEEKINVMKNNNLKKLKDALLHAGYVKNGDWYIDYENNLQIKFNKRTIFMKGLKGKQLTYANAEKTTLKDLEFIIQSACV